MLCASVAFFRNAWPRIAGEPLFFFFTHISLIARVPELSRTAGEHSRPDTYRSVHCMTFYAAIRSSLVLPCLIKLPVSVRSSPPPTIVLHRYT